MAMDDERQVNQQERGGPEQEPLPAPPAGSGGEDEMAALRMVSAAEQRKEERAADSGERTKEKKGTGEGGEQKAGKARRLPPIRNLPRLLILLAVVLVVVVLTTMEDGNHFVTLRRWLMYGDSGTGENEYAYVADNNNRFALLGDSLLLANQNTIQLLDDDGTIRYNMSVSMTSPLISSGGDLAAVCDIGGSSLYLMDENGVRRSMETSGGLRYYSARLNSSGWLAVTEEKNGYKASVSVYNSSGELVFSFDSYDNYISDALVTEDCKSVVAVGLGAQDGTFGSTLLVYDLSGAVLAASCQIRDGLTMDIACGKKGQIMALCDTRMAMADSEGNLLLDYPYGNLYLHNYALDGENFTALLLGKYQAGNICELTTFDQEGQEIATLEITEEVLDMSAAGEYLAVLYSDSLVIYTRDLKEHAQLVGTDYAGQVIMEPGGTALVIAGTSAWRFLP